MSDTALRTALHARVTPDPKSGYVATFEQIAVVTQGETLDEVAANLRKGARLWHFTCIAVAGRPASVSMSGAPCYHEILA